ncbi:copper homeostasis periplasmic binding protein CopC [Ralstonia soli]|uniref:Copper homeostasis periplasmic binding protein CopC n=1 Tax=Ralstonia soli TaxID=2953896 RepID=A0ABT1AGB1_9RALS|nr:copper homeostasis periplasmic binding protein CopC [Ralstonia soli]MCO5397432.1 copper homeostasis periplasmic binding protein CopC [Ralstonia soli]
MPTLTFSRVAQASVAVVAALAASVALAHPKLLSASPADQSSGPAPAQIALHFSEKLVAQFCDATVVMTGASGPVNVASKVATSSDGRTLTVSPAQPLGRGAYRVDWHVVAADTHRVSGHLAFQVK